MRNKKKFNEFMNKTIEELKDEKRYGTAHVLSLIHISEPTRPY